MRYWIFLLPILVACGTQEEPFNPALDTPVFKEALKRSLLIEARANKERVELKLDSIPIDRYYDAMFNDMGIDREDFRSTYTVYTKHPKKLEDLFEEVAQDLKVEVDSLEKVLNP